MSRRQSGQEPCLTSQQSMQGAWKTWRHPGSLRAGSPTRKSCRHTEQQTASPAASTALSAAISIAGSRRSASAVMPLLLPPVSNRSLVSANGELMALICMQRVHKNNQEKHQDRKSQQTI